MVTIRSRILSLKELLLGLVLLGRQERDLLALQLSLPDLEI